MQRSSRQQPVAAMQQKQRLSLPGGRQQAVDLSRCCWPMATTSTTKRQQVKVPVCQQTSSAAATLTDHLEFQAATAATAISKQVATHKRSLQAALAPLALERCQVEEALSGSGRFEDANVARASRRRRRRRPCAHSRRGQCVAFLAAFAALATLCATLRLQVEAIKLQPEGKEKFYWSGEQFVITCQNNNNIKNVKIRWIGPNGTDITEDRSQRIHAESTGPHGHRLVVMNATATTDDGQYKCTLGSTDDKFPRQHIEFDLKIHKTTSFKDTPRHLVLPAGKTGTLICQVEFDPSVLSASVSWVRDQTPLEKFDDSRYTVSEYDPVTQTSRLQISPITKQHDGIYTCRAMAVTSQLSKISDHDIRLETNYAPHFEDSSQTVWVESIQSLASRQTQFQTQWANQYGARPTVVAGSGGGGQHPGNTGYARSRNKHGQSPPAGQSAGGHEQYANNSPGLRLGPGGPRHHHGLPEEQQGVSNQALPQGSEKGPQVVRVELHCSCQSNPPASIMWTSTQSSKYVLAKGKPEHILEEPQSIENGQNTTSTLVISYNLDPDWPHRRDQYFCSASNKLGVAVKTFNVEQGDPPPAFNVGPSKQYNPQNSMFAFTLLGPNFDPDGPQEMMSGSANTREIIPPVDSLRIRAVSNTAATTAGGQPGGEPRPLAGNYLANMRRLNEQPSVQWSLDQQRSGGSESRFGGSNNFQQHHSSASSQAQQLNRLPQNFTVNLGRLPSGNQKLYLDAHNAVGWSPNATYLGDYYIVSGASSYLYANTYSPFQLALNLLLLLAGLQYLNNGPVFWSPIREINNYS